MKNIKIITTFLLVIIVSTFTNAKEITTTLEDQTKLNVTIYNNDTALIKDTRNLALNKGINILAFKGVSAYIKPETAILTTNKLELLEQNFEYDLLTYKSLLNKYIGKEITIPIKDYPTGKMVEKKAIVLANNDDNLILKIDDKILSLRGGHNSLVYNELPKDLRDKPTLIMKIDNLEKGSRKKDIKLTYLTNKLNWKADYVISLLDDKTLNIKGWVTLANNSGTTYKNANLQLVAGEVNLVKDINDRYYFDEEINYEKAMSSYKTTAREESLFEYHLYTINFPTTIKNKQQKQVSLLEAENVPYKKRLFVLANNYWEKRIDNEYQDEIVRAEILINNKKTDNLGMPIPAGIARSYKNDSRGNSQFIGEDRIKHTPENEKISLQLGKSFDITVKSKQTNFQYTIVKGKDKYHSKKKVYTASYKVIFKNAKDKSVSVDYTKLLFGNKWKITQQSLTSKKISSTKNLWQVKVPAKGEVTLTYTIKFTK